MGEPENPICMISGFLDRRKSYLWTWIYQITLKNARKSKKYAFNKIRRPLFRGATRLRGISCILYQMSSVRLVSILNLLLITFNTMFVAS